MPTTTPELSLYKYNTDTDGNMTYNITNSMNNNWDKIDTYCGNLSSNKADKTTVNAALDLKADASTVNTALALKADKTVIHALKGYEDAGELLTDADGLQDVKNYAHSTFDSSKFTITNAAIISNGVASHFYSSGTDYGVVGTTDNITFGSTFDFYFEFTTPQSAPGSNQSFLITNSIQGISVVFMTTNKIAIQYGDGTQWITPNLIYGSHTLSLSTSYIGKLTYKGSKYELFTSVDNGLTWVKESEYTSATQFLPTGKLNFGGGRGGNGAFTGSMDLKQVKIINNGIPVFSGNKTGIDTIKPDDYTVVGTPTISEDGVASGFSTSSYLTSSVNITNQTDIVIKGSWVHTNSTDRQWLIAIYNSSANAETIQILPNESGNLMQARVCIGANTFGSISFTDEQVPKIIGKKYNFELTIKGTKATFTVNGVSSSRNDFYAFTSTNFNIGASINGSYPFKGLADLNDLQVYINGNLVYQPCLKIPYTESAEKYGSKIVNAVYRDRVQGAWQQNYPQRYYILDEENGNYTLPAGEIYGMIESCLNVNNPTVAEKETVTAWSVPDYTSGIAINQSSFPYTAVSTGYIVGGITVGSAGTEGRNLLVNNGIILHVPVNGTRFYFLPVEKGDILSVNVAASVTASAYFYPAKGV